jgi:hypothetical protein
MIERRTNYAVDYATITSYITEKLGRGERPAVRSYQLTKEAADWVAQQLGVTYTYKESRKLYIFHPHGSKVSDIQ